MIIQGERIEVVKHRDENIIYHVRADHVRGIMVISTVIYLDDGEEKFFIGNYDDAPPADDDTRADYVREKVKEQIAAILHLSPGRIKFWTYMFTRHDFRREKWEKTNYIKIPEASVDEVRDLLLRTANVMAE